MAGCKIEIAGCSPAVMRIVPAGLPRSSLERRQFCLDLLEPRANRLQQALPASVGATLRVVRVSSRSSAAPPSP